MQEESLLEMLRDVINRVRLQISGERNERERNEETFLNLLEATCNKLNLVSREL